MFSAPISNKCRVGNVDLCPREPYYLIFFRLEMQNPILTNQISLFFLVAFCSIPPLSPNSLYSCICQHMFPSMFYNRRCCFVLTCFPSARHRIRIVCLSELRAEICAVAWIRAALRVAVSVDCVIPVVQPAYFLAV